MKKNMMKKRGSHGLVVGSAVLFLLMSVSVSAQTAPMPTGAAPPAGEPTNAVEAARQNKAPSGVEQKDYDAYRALLDGLSPQEREWERALEKHLGNFYFPLHLKDRLNGRSNAWDYVKDDPALPRIILIGDSISRSYTQGVRKLLAGKANVHRAPANCGPATTGLQRIGEWLTEGQGARDEGDWDVIVFNFGIHDRNRKPEEYAENLEKLVVRLKATGAKKLLWVRTTPFNDKNDPQDMPPKGARLNEAADPVMKRYEIPVCDLYTPFLPRVGELIGSDRTHFTGPGQALLAEEVVKAILPLLPEKKEKP